VLPLLAPVAAKLGISPVWFAIMIGMNMQTSFLTPPFGFALFYLRGVAPREIRTGEIYKGTIPFVLVQLTALVIVISFPALVTGTIETPDLRVPAAEMRLPVPENAREQGAGGSARRKAGKSSEEDKAAADIDRMLREGK